MESEIFQIFCFQKSERNPNSMCGEEGLAARAMEFQQREVKEEGSYEREGRDGSQEKEGILFPKHDF
ncbi:hypothetical protein MA16_Dca002842 [Dendrobium catenatum]|uniref:Uncharacterized protein n=1 Tax=Dendrobium catenatum TaxID=906689 RepID=A0A2I0X8S9_9ASPA|nr:hypothetical protein MA16_Dca002842 [Dendrobium catenatum]